MDLYDMPPQINVTHADNIHIILYMFKLRDMIHPPMKRPLGQQL